jgi:hypothetical protein
MATSQIMKTVGSTKDAGWQFGLRKTFHYRQSEVWDFMFSPEGQQVWLGKTKQELSAGEPFQTDDGLEGTVSVLKPYSHIRLTWKPKDRNQATWLQVRVMGDDQKAVISFHHDHLDSEEERAEI